MRQSSPYQVIHNLESRKLQYAMEERLHQLGWREIEVVDDDLGRSAAGLVTRAGFEGMVAEVCLGKSGSGGCARGFRFARNSREWQQLVEVCRVVDTVLIGAYPTSSGMTGGKVYETLLCAAHIFRVVVTLAGFLRTTDTPRRRNEEAA